MLDAPVHMTPEAISISNKTKLKQLRLVGLGKGGNSCPQFSMLVTSSRVALGQSPTMEAGPKLNRLIEVVMELM